MELPELVSCCQRIAAKEFSGREHPFSCRLELLNHNSTRSCGNVNSLLVKLQDLTRLPLSGSGEDQRLVNNQSHRLGISLPVGKAAGPGFQAPDSVGNLCRWQRPVDFSILPMQPWCRC